MGSRDSDTDSFAQHLKLLDAEDVDFQLDKADVENEPRQVRQIVRGDGS